MVKSSVVERAPEGRSSGARFGLSEARSVDKPHRREFFDLHPAVVLVILWLVGEAIIASPYLIWRWL
jgi:hypothetical protein